MASSGNGADIFARLPIRQIAYFVEEIREAAKKHSLLFGSGPYFIGKSPCERYVHRGVDRPLEQSIALGQWGDLMIEFIEQHNPGPSAYRDLYPEGSGRWGMHHVALIVDDCQKVVKDFTNAGHRVAAIYTPLPQMDVFFIDCLQTHGHMVEIYEGVPPIRGLYDFVSDAARGFDGRNVIREMPTA